MIYLTVGRMISASIVSFRAHSGAEKQFNMQLESAVLLFFA
jgi:hypothetical protein